MFLEPIRAASYRGHDDIVRLILADDGPKILKDKLVCQTLIVNYYNDHTGILDLTLGPSWQKCEAEPENTHELQDLALRFTRSPETFKRLLEQAKPHIRRYTRDQDDDPRIASKYYSWYSSRVYDAAAKGKTDLLRYLIEVEKAEKIYEEEVNDTSLFQSRHPATFVTGFKSQDRPVTILSVAARRGDAEAVKTLLNAGFKNDRAIEFAAMCGSRTIVRLLWDHGGHENEAVQGALAMAVDREDVAMFNLLVELGAKLDDDVRVAITQKAKEEGLESMMDLLASFQLN